MIKHLFFYAIFLVMAWPQACAFAQFGGISNTPFDRETWRRTMKNTPFDPKTWIDTIDSLQSPLGVVFETYANKTASDNADKPRTSLTYSEKYFLRPWYGDLVDKVTVIWNARFNRDIKDFQQVFIIPGAQTFGQVIYVGDPHNEGSTRQLCTLAHEMLHAWQYEQIDNNLRRFGQKYLEGISAKFLEGRSPGESYFNVPQEVDAYNFELRYAKWLNEESGFAADSELMEYKTGRPEDMRSPVPLPIRYKLLPQEYAVTCVENGLNFPLSVNYRWGDGPMTYVIVESSKILHLTYPYPGGKFGSPNLELRYKKLLRGDGEVSEILQRCRNTNPQSCEGVIRYLFTSTDTHVRLDRDGRFPLAVPRFNVTNMEKSGTVSIKNTTKGTIEVEVFDASDSIKLLASVEVPNGETLSAEDHVKRVCPTLKGDSLIRVSLGNGSTSQLRSVYEVADYDDSAERYEVDVDKLFDDDPKIELQNRTLLFPSGSRVSRQGDGSWLEIGSKGEVICSFRQLSQDSNFLMLREDTRRFVLTIPLHRGAILWQYDGEGTVTWGDAQWQ